MSKKARRPKTVIPTMRSYDLDTILGGRGGSGGFGGGDELDDAMRQARKFQADRMKSTIIKKTQLELDKEVQDMEKGMNTGGSSSGTLSGEELSYLTQLPEEQKATAIQAMAAFKGQSGGNNAAGSLAPLLVMSMLNKQPQTGVGELVVALRGLNDIVQTGKPPANTNDLTNMIAIANLIASSKDTAYQTQIQMLNKQMEDMKPHDPLEYQRNLIEVAKASGFTPAGGMNPEIERMKVENEKYLQKSDQEFRLLLMKMEKDDKRNESLINMLTEVLKPFAAKAGDLLPGVMGGMAGGAVVKASQPQQGGPLPVKCPKCGYEPIWVSEESPIALCPNCKNGGVDTAVTHPSFSKQQPPGGAPPQMGGGPGVPPPPSG